jgi:putative hydrolase of the HAD superfamily
MLKAVVFDLYETLVTETGTAVPRAGALGEGFGLDATAYRREWKQQRPRVLRGEVTFREALTQVGERLGVEIHPDLVQRASDERANARVAIFRKCDPDLVALTRELRERGIRLAVISNCFEEDIREWPTCAFAPQFESTIFSFAAGMLKPDPRIYLKAVEQLGVKAADTLYVGDGGDDELAGAEQAGLRAAQAGWFVARTAPAAVPFLSSPRDALSLVAGG